MTEVDPARPMAEMVMPDGKNPGQEYRCAPTRRLVAAVAMLLAIAPATAHAHGLAVSAEVDCRHVVVEATFTDGTPVAFGAVRVLDAADETLKTTTLDADGRLSFPLDGIDTAARVTVIVESGEHDGFWDIIPRDFEQGCSG